MRLNTVSVVALTLITISLAANANNEQPRFAVMGLHLQMSAEEVLTSLYAQGVSEENIEERFHPCSRHSGIACTDKIIARLRDGPLTVSFAEAPPGFNDGREAAFSISYKPSGPGRGLDNIRDVAQQQFGTFESTDGGTWCATGASGDCPEDRPRLTFRRLSAGVGDLGLTDFGLPLRMVSQLRGPDPRKAQSGRLGSEK